MQRLVRNLSFRLFFRFLITELAYLATLFGILFIGIFFSTMFRWQPYDPVYRFLITIADNIFLVMIVLSVSGMLIIFYYYWRKIIHYIDDLVCASEIMMDHEDTTVSLPQELSLVQDRMNQMKLEFLRSQRIAKEAEQRKNDLIVYLAHDLKTPLTSVLGYVTLLEEEREISKELQDKYLSIARNKAERLEELINEFFEITRFNLTTLTLEPGHVNLSRMLQQITYEFQPLASEKGVHIELDIQTEMNVLLDVDKIERVFDNLLRNAINYSYENSVISVFAAMEKDEIHLRFENQGNTIPEEKLNRLFDQFYRLDSSRATKSGGAGLGLAIAKEIVELHHGQIKAESKEEKIIFDVRIPQPL